LAVVHQLNFNPIPQNSKVLYLDGIKDPGNLGTIIRSADAFGWNNIVLAPQCVELYNPKVVQSTMGSLFHVNVHLDKDGSFIRNARSNQRSIVGADLKGEKLLNSTIPGANAVLVIGSESHGLSDAVRENINHYVNIEQAGNAESLNAAIAASIIMHQWGA
jgi:TrmH family RNA methyltransferase